MATWMDLDTMKVIGAEFPPSYWWHLTGRASSGAVSGALQRVGVNSGWGAGGRTGGKAAHMKSVREKEHGNLPSPGEVAMIDAGISFQDYLNATARSESVAERHFKSQGAGHVVGAWKRAQKRKADNPSGGAELTEVPLIDITTPAVEPNDMPQVKIVERGKQMERASEIAASAVTPNVEPITAETIRAMTESLSEVTKHVTNNEAADMATAMFRRIMERV